MTKSMPICLLTCLCGSLGTAQPAGGGLALVGGTIYVNPNDPPIRNGIVLIQDGKIAAVGNRSQASIPNSAQSIDCSGLSITAGFWNSHVHLFERKWANAATIPAAELGRQVQDMLTRYGFTSVFDIASQWTNTRALRSRIESGEVPGPQIRSTGEALVPPGALPPEIVFRILGEMIFPLPEVADVAQAATTSKKLLDEGVDGIKLFTSSPPNTVVDVAVVRSAVDQAHRVNKPVFAHPGNNAGLLAAVNGGVDIIAHTTPQSGPWDQATISAMKEHNVALIPTLQVWSYNSRHDRHSTHEQVVNTAIAQLRAWLGVGGQVLFGTDVGYVDYDPAEEHALMARAGMTFRQILRSLTSAPADRFGDAERLGRIATGYQADLVVMRGDPSVNLRSFTDVRYTIRAGKIIYRAAD